MTRFEMTKDEASTLARYIELIRKRLPGDTWHKPGIEDALARARHRADSPDLAQAAIAAARRPENRTPAVIGMDGPHWREAENRPRPEKLISAERCSVCSESEQRCRERWSDDDHAFEPASVANARKGKTDVPRVVETLKADLQPTATPKPATGLDALEARDPKLKAAVDAVRERLPGVRGNDAEEAMG